VSEKQALNVEILGRAYRVRANADPQYAQDLARYVEDQMRAISEKATTDSLKVAVLAALNIANDFFESQKVQKEQERQVAERADTLLRMVGG
jgi:cell division protein ZapA